MSHTGVEESNFVRSVPANTTNGGSHTFMGRQKNGNGVDFYSVSNTFKMVVAPMNDEQKVMMRTIAQNTVTFVKGAPGTGKTFLSVTYALQQLLRSKFEKIVLTRPIVEAAGEKLGFLPGDMFEKINPYMIPIFDSIMDLIPVDIMNKLIQKNGKEAVIRVLPLAFMRGITFKNSFVICDEMQNSTPDQVRMLLTRIGEGTKMIVCGDVEQSDIYDRNGLQDAFGLLEGIDDVGFVTLTDEAIVRHPIVKAIDKRYADRLKQRKKEQQDEYQTNNRLSA